MTMMIRNCDQEPIHALGLLQGHGALVAFDKSGLAVTHSVNARSLLGALPDLGAPSTDAHFDAAARKAIARSLAEPELTLENVECSGPQGQAFDLVLHWSENLLLAEWETKPPDAPPATHYATLVQRAIQHLQLGAALSVEQLLQIATDAVQTLTGFDRVMAYRFLHDDSGEVIAESRRADLPPYLHLRYPAGDIPAQARRLYVLNPIRHIANVLAQPVAMAPTSNPHTGQPFNLSHSILRSVSPTHIEYLKNMGVVASMSVSIVVDGKLWGLIACHHMEPLCVSHAVRLSCTVLTQVLAIMVERTELSQRALAESRIENLRSQVATALASAEDATAGLLAANDALLSLIPSDGFSIVVGQRVGSFPIQLDRLAAIKVADHMTDNHQGLLVTDSVVRDVPQLSGLHPEANKASGILAIQMTGETTITIIWWRAELVETIKWAGARDKVATVGSDGNRLSPRKSFEVWKETVRGSSKAWNNTDRFAAHELKAILQEVALNQMRAMEHERTALLSIMGHDLRDPLQAIDMVVTLMGYGVLSTGDGAKRIEHSSRRMQSLIAYILDVSRLRTGIGLAMAIQRTALGHLLTETLNQAQLAHPGVEMEITVAELGYAEVDGDRLVQAISNLLSNARHHGDMRFPIRVNAYYDGDQRRIEITNRIAPGQYFNPGPMTAPFKASSMNNPNNKTGLGLGLYIANAIVIGHGGILESRALDGAAQFTIVLNNVADIDPLQEPLDALHEPA
jgi:light-regulated signal transduction histidine kinase (bacteriophytochrome)